MLCVYDGESRSSVYTSILGLKSVYNFKSKALKTIDSQAKRNTKNVAEDTCYKTQRVSSLFVVIFFFFLPSSQRMPKWPPVCVDCSTRGQ